MKNRKIIQMLVRTNLPALEEETDLETRVWVDTLFKSVKAASKEYPLEVYREVMVKP
jgi:hypothetical protein